MTLRFFEERNSDKKSKENAPFFTCFTVRITDFMGGSFHLSRPCAKRYIFGLAFGENHFMALIVLVDNKKVRGLIAK
jgi:hypothetical protein